MADKTVTCTNHCGACHRHFHSLDAFDLHHDHDADGRTFCLDPVDLVDRGGKQRLEALTTAGECRVYAQTRYGVTIWIVAGSRERARGVWHADAPESPVQAA